MRQRKVSSRVDTVTASERRSAASARLEALETDHDAGPAVQDSDDEFVLDDSDEGTKRTVYMRLETKRYWCILLCRRAANWQEQSKAKRQAAKEQENKRNAC